MEECCSEFSTKGMRLLNENHLIRNAFFCSYLWVLVACFLSIFFPLVYLIAPVHESEICLCSFYKQNEDRHFLLPLNLDNFYTLLSISDSAFSLMNWFAQTVIVIMLYRIRHTSDDAWVKIECTVIVASWVFFTILQQGLFWLTSFYSCQLGNEMSKVGQDPNKYSEIVDNIYQATFWIIIARDFSVVAIMLTF